MEGDVQTHEGTDTRRTRWRERIVTSLILLAVGVAIFWPFIAGDGVLLYRDIGKDSWNSYYMNFVHLSNYIRTEGFPSWSFHIGMGQDMAHTTGFLLLEPVSLLPSRFIAQALVFQHLLKVLVAGLFFLRFLQLQRAPTPVALLGSLVFAFSAYMTLGSSSPLLTEELLVFTALLVGVETALRRGRWLLLVLSVALAGLINPFYLYLAALFLACYVPLRVFARNGWKPGPTFKRCLVLAPLALLGVAFAAIVTLPFLKVILNSPSGANATNNLSLLGSVPVFGLQPAAHYVTALLRPLCNEFLGTGNSFRGFQNYVEAPQTYCGLICILLLPQALLGGTRRHRVVVALFLLWLVIPSVFPWFRFLFWLFKGDYHRSYSLFSVLGIVVLSLFGFRHYLEGRKFSFWLLWAWALVLVGILYLPWAPLQDVIDPRLRLVVAGGLLLYPTILFIGRLTSQRTLATYLVVAVTAAELIFFDRISVCERNFFKKSELVEGLAVRADAAQAVADLKRDDNSFFRITSLHAGEHGTETEYNESMLLGYNGTASFSSFNDSNYIRFLAAAEMLPSLRETDTRWTAGLAGNFLLSMFAAEKYVLVEDPEPFVRAAQYELIRPYGKSSLLRNALSLPLGLSYTRYVTETEFLQLTPDGKEQALLSVAVLAPDGLAAVQGLTRASGPDLEREFTAVSFPALIQKRRASALYPSSFAQNHLVGDVRLEQDGILILQTPFNSGWSAVEDGQAVPIVRADFGLLGLPVKAGEHRVELHYRNPWLFAGVVVTSVAALLLVILLWRKPRLTVSLA